MEENHEVVDEEKSSSEEGDSDSDNEDTIKSRRMESIFSSISISDDHQSALLNKQLSP